MVDRRQCAPAKADGFHVKPIAVQAPCGTKERHAIAIERGLFAPPDPEWWPAEEF